MKKKLWLALAAGMMTLAMSMTAFAGEWKQDTAGWWYQNDDSTYPANGWNWVDGKCYYFTPEGYCLLNTQTPDGYMVDASGAWIVDGVVQTQTQQPVNTSSDLQVGNMVFTVPAGFALFNYENELYYYANEGTTTVIGVGSTLLDEDESYYDYWDQMGEALLDAAIGDIIPSAAETITTKQFPSGTWRCYYYSDATSFGVPGSMQIYGQIVRGRMNMFIFAGAVSASDADGVMNNNLK